MNKNNLVTKHVSRLFRFLIQFGINRFELLDSSEKNINAIIGWPEEEGQFEYNSDEETQEISWEVQYLEFIDDALTILEFAFSKGLFDSDKILISEEELRVKMNWDKIRFSNALNNLLQIKIDMIDEGEKTDFFYVHF